MKDDECLLAVFALKPIGMSSKVLSSEARALTAIFCLAA